jgi:hypothetical protein
MTCDIFKTKEKTISFHFIINISGYKIKVAKCVKLRNKKLKIQLMVAIRKTHSSIHIYITLICLLSIDRMPLYDSIPSCKTQRSLYG